MDPERRHSDRKNLGQSSYIQFETTSGGIVLNASELGLAFHAVAPVIQSGPLRFTVSPDPEQRIDLIGEIVWLDPSKKSGGLRFMAQSQDALKHVRDWLALPAQLQIPPEARPLPSWPPTTEVEQPSHKKDVPIVPPVPEEFSRPAPPILRVSNFPRPAIPNTVSSAAVQSGSVLRELQWFASQSQWIHNLAAPMLVCALALGALLVVRQHRSGFGESLIQFGEKIKGKAARESQPPNLISSNNPAATTTSPAAHLPLTASENAVHPASSSLALRNTTPTAPTSSANTPVRTHDSRHSYQHPDTSRSQLAQHLWSAVGNGDNTAAILLADLYLTGEGVPKSCEQARVLLQVASKRGNADALQRLQIINKSNCR